MPWPWEPHRAPTGLGWFRCRAGRRSHDRTLPLSWAGAAGQDVAPPVLRLLGPWCPGKVSLAWALGLSSSRQRWGAATALTLPDAGGVKPGSGPSRLADGLCGSDPTPVLSKPGAAAPAAPRRGAATWRAPRPSPMSCVNVGASCSPQPQGSSPLLCPPRGPNCFLCCRFFGKAACFVGLMSAAKRSELQPLLRAG